MLGVGRGGGTGGAKQLDLMYLEKVKANPRGKKEERKGISCSNERAAHILSHMQSTND